MTDNKDQLSRIEGKLDLALIAITKHETDINWLKGGGSILLLAILGACSWIASAYFSTLGK